MTILEVGEGGWHEIEDIFHKNRAEWVSFIFFEPILSIRYRRIFEKYERILEKYDNYDTIFGPGELKNKRGKIFAKLKLDTIVEK